MGTVGSGERTALERTLVRVCTALRAANVPFAVTGGSGVYARGGPLPEHDVDVLVRPDDVDDAVRALLSVGMRATDAPEDWLRKVYDGAVPVDLIYRPAECPVTHDTLAAAEELHVASVQAPVAPATDIVADKLLSLGAQHCDFGWILPAARALREQIDWAALRARTEHHPYAEAFLLLADRLGISSPDRPGGHNHGSAGTPSRAAPVFGGTASPGTH
ncbi:MAG TPA: nucleotidyltransferase family protein [Pseudonocardiaceae bacterium]|nr:nucleotidyltransferase family protein [Pseudonocardiaceae bacterium]